MAYGIFTKPIRIVRIPLSIYFLRKILELFGKNRRNEYIQNHQYRFSTKRHTELVKKNRAMLGHLIPVVCALGKLDLAFRVSEGSVTSTKITKLRLDADLKARIDGSGVFEECPHKYVMNLLQWCQNT